MGLTEDYAERVQEVERSVEEVFSREDASRLKKFLDSILPFAVLSLAFVLLVGFVIPVNYEMVRYINYVNWFVIVYFAARLGVGLRLASSKKHFMEQHWLDFALVIPAFSLLQELRMLEMMEEFEFMNVEGGKVLGSVVATQTLGVATKLTRITRVVKKSIIG
ncbi:MAG: hypothetical protein ABEJ72_00380 [Candidatus Aenigmatarchaeota archaeon]